MRSPTEATTTLVAELMTVNAGIRRVIRRQVGGGLTGGLLPPAQVELLGVVEREPGIGVAAAARVLDLAGNSVSSLVNALVTAGLLVRETDPVDRRAARLRLTPAARRRMAYYRGTRNDLVGHAFEQLDPDDRAAIERAVPALTRLLAELRIQLEKAQAESGNEPGGGR